MRSVRRRGRRVGSINIPFFDKRRQRLRLTLIPWAGHVKIWYSARCEAQYNTYHAIFSSFLRSFSYMERKKKGISYSNNTASVLCRWSFCTLPGHRWWRITAWFELRPFSHGGLGVEVDSLIGGHSVGRGEGRTRSAIALRCGFAWHRTWSVPFLRSYR